MLMLLYRLPSRKYTISGRENDVLKLVLGIYSWLEIRKKDIKVKNITSNTTYMTPKNKWRKEVKTPYKCNNVWVFSEVTFQRGKKLGPYQSTEKVYNKYKELSQMKLTLYETVNIQITNPINALRKLWLNPLLQIFNVLA